jgi:hypothetical protein
MVLLVPFYILYIQSLVLITWLVNARAKHSTGLLLLRSCFSVYKYRCKKKQLDLYRFSLSTRSLMSDPRRRWFFFPVWRRNDDEGVALVPSESEQEQQPPGRPRQEEVISLTKDPAAAGPGSSSSSRAGWWPRRVVPATRGVGLVIGGLVVLAVLLATTTHLDISSVYACSVILY